MLLTVTPDDRPDWAFTLIGGSPLNDWPRSGLVWGLSREGLEGWYEPAEVRADEMPDLPGVNGSFTPEEQFLTARVLTIRGFVYAVTGEASSVGVARARDRMAALNGAWVSISVSDASGVREVHGHVVSVPTNVSLRAGRLCEFTLIVRCPDPVKYGVEVVAPAAGTTPFRNDGTAPVAPVLRVTGRVTRLDVRQSIRDSMGRWVQRRLEWQGNTVGLTLDLAEGLPLDSSGYEVGQLVWADVIRLWPGQGSLLVSRDGPAGTTVSMSYRHGWL